MIDPKELRIGNYISYYIYDQQNPHPDTIKSIYFDDESKEYHLEMESGNFSLDHLTIQEIKPIPLTEDILLKCGFENFGFGIFSISINVNDIWSKTFSIQNGFCFLVGVDDDPINEINTKEIEYLHELQNLFYDLTKTELNIKL